jgi:hypothetical protein
MFPVGAAGCGLLILRVCAAGMLMRGAIPTAAAAISVSVFIGLAIVASLLCLGLFTPASCVAAGIIQIAMGFDPPDKDPFQFAFSLSVDAALFLIGPGAYSIDSRLFGRRLIVSSK